MLKPFLEKRLGKWKRLEELTLRASRFRLSTLSGEEVREFGRLYRRTAADLAIAREEVRDRRLINYLNHLVTRAHGAIYRSESSGFGGVLRFIRYGFPLTFRKTFWFSFTSFLIFMAPAFFAFLLGMMTDSFGEQVSPRLKNDIAAHRNWTDVLNESNPLASTSIQTNNITVTFMAFAGGLLLGVGTVLIMVYNGILLGTVFGLCVRYRFWEILTFVSAHGVIELTAIFISGGAGLMLAKAILIPGDMRRSDALVVNGLQAIRLLAGCIPLLLVAGLIEGFISPAHVSPFYKVSVSATSLLFLVAYLLNRDPAEKAAGSSSGNAANQ